MALSRAKNVFYHTIICLLATDLDYYKKNHKTWLQHPRFIQPVESAVMRYNRCKLCFLVNQCNLVHRITVLIRIVIAICTTTCLLQQAAKTNIISRVLKKIHDIPAILLRL